MHRPRVSAVCAGFVTALIAVPLLATPTLAADPVVVVKSGDTLTAISKRHGVSIDRLVRLNGLDSPNRIYVGQRLRLSAPSTSTSTSAGSGRRTHTVRAGEHLTGIARHYGTSVSAIVAANDITDPSRIFAGQRLAIPTAGGSRSGSSGEADGSGGADTSPARTHTVRAGEHLTGIARHYGVSVRSIVAANGIADASRIYAGQRLAIPARGGDGTRGASDDTASRPSMPASMARLVRERESVRRVIVHAARQQGVPVGFALAVAWHESGWQQRVTSSAGAIGVMQLMPGTARWIGEAMLGRPVDPRDLRSNVTAGVRLLRHYLDRYDGDRSLVLAAYYQGQAAVDRHGIYAVSRPYIASIRVLTEIFAP